MLAFIRSVGGLLCLLNVPAMAHESRPIYIELKQTAPEEYQLQWKAPASVPPFNVPTISLPGMCKERSQVIEFTGVDGIARRSSYQCLEPLSGHSILIAYPEGNPSLSSLIRYDTLSGERHTAVLGPQELSWRIPPARETAQGVARQYVRLGIAHIWAGTDHLLFLACLIWIARGSRRVLAAVTGFTLAHSATLILSALQIIQVAVPPVEASIALSIVYLAAELVKGPRRSLTWHYPIAISSSFGLLHGFGFAAALTETGLPRTEVATGLLFFNVGVELGQLLFVAGAWGLMKSGLWVRSKGLVTMLGTDHVRKVFAYISGAIAAFWFMERGIAIVAT